MDKKKYFHLMKRRAELVSELEKIDKQLDLMKLATTYEKVMGLSKNKAQKTKVKKR